MEFSVSARLNGSTEGVLAAAASALTAHGFRDGQATERLG
jgi:hypothetical protein